MAEIGSRSGKVRAGFYRCGSYCIHKGRGGWSVYLRDKFVRTFRSLGDSYSWCRRNEPPSITSVLEFCGERYVLQ